MEFQTDTLFLGLLDASGESREAYRSLAHYWESEKYRDIDETTRQIVLDVPTVRELTKAVSRLPQTWRPDWPKVRARVFRCALHYAAEGEPQSFAHDLSIDRLVASCVKWGMPEAFARREISTFLAHHRNPLRLLAVGSAKAPRPHVHATLERLIGERQDVQYVAFAGRGMDASLHQWAATRHFPLVYEGASSDQPLGKAGKRRLIERCTHLVVFTSEGNAADADAMQTARELGRTVRISQYRRDDTASHADRFDARTAARPLRSV